MEKLADSIYQRNSGYLIHTFHPLLSVTPPALEKLNFHFLLIVLCFILPLEQINRFITYLKQFLVF